MKRLVKCFAKMRQVRRRLLPPFHELSDEDSPGLNPSSDEDCPSSDELVSEIEKVEVRAGRFRRRRRANRRSD